jgi:hypothetical protein
MEYARAGGRPIRISPGRVAGNAGASYFSHERAAACNTAGLPEAHRPSVVLPPHMAQKMLLCRYGALSQRPISLMNPRT